MGEHVAEQVVEVVAATFGVFGCAERLPGVVLEVPAEERAVACQQEPDSPDSEVSGQA
ncbi:hypothetical protein L3Q67_26125 [Saccharothrix sp. AJ9571]|nr:hypothetical protein L3Q67_26125 [Saccharothrix sp. AJ9571]